MGEDKCQITGVVSVYDCADKISCPLLQLNSGCMEGYCTGPSPDRPTLIYCPQQQAGRVRSELQGGESSDVGSLSSKVTVDL